MEDRPERMRPIARNPEPMCSCCAHRVPHHGESQPVLSIRNEVAMRCVIQDQLVWSISRGCEHHRRAAITRST
jgi:hypothetical protein